MLTSLIASYYNLLVLGYKQREGRGCYRTYKSNNLRGINSRSTDARMLSHFSQVQLFATPVDHSPPGSSVHGKNTWVGCHALLQGIFLTQGSNVCLLCMSPALQADSLPLRYWEAPTKKNTYCFFLDIAPGSATFTFMGFLHTKNIFITIIPV